jgi:hypothetical protein
VPVAASSPIPAVLVKLGPLDIGRVADLRPFLDLVPDPRARQGRWYSLTAIRHTAQPTRPRTPLT